MSWKNTIKKAQVDVDGFKNIALFFFNTRPREVIGELFGEKYEDMENHRKDYVGKYIQAFQDNPLKLWSMLDDSKRKKLVQLINERYP